MRSWLVALLVVGVFGCGAAAEEARPGPVPDGLRDALKLDRFYQKHLDAGGLPVLGSAKVSDNALAEAAWIVRQMLTGRDDILRAMKDTKVRVVVMAAGEYTTDVPEHSRMSPKPFWDRRARGLGATPANPVVSCGEENLLTYPRDPYPNENIFVHEFAHAVHGTGLNRVDPTFDRRLRAAYDAGRERGLWKNTYAATNKAEYWAEGVQCWFDDNAPADALHNHVRTRDQLKQYDPDLAKLCAEVFGDRAWRYQKPAARKPEDRRHLTDYDPTKLPRFRWREAPMVDKPRATVQTEVGEFEVELDAKAAPEATKQFLGIALDGGYHSGRMEAGGAGSVRATPNAGWRDKWLKDLKLDKLPSSSARLADGEIAMIRDKNAPSCGFIIVTGDRPGGGTEEFVRFGQVVKGMEVVRKIQASPADIRRVIRTR
jgi:cyclophilin family peptidyl-prolyl cis-trans isomerase